VAKCDQGYLCEVCGEPVDVIVESDLYLRFVLGELKASDLPACPERHLRCNPVMAQFIDDPGFEPVTVEGDFDRRLLDEEFVSRRVAVVTRGWRRLCEINGSDTPVPLTDYPLPEFQPRPGVSDGRLQG